MVLQHALIPDIYRFLTLCTFSSIYPWNQQLKQQLLSKQSIYYRL